MTVILRIAHLQYAQVPTKLEPEALLQIAILCDKYELFNLISLHFGPLWIGTVDLKLDQVDTAFVFYALKQKQRFAKTSVGIVREMELDETGASLNATGQNMVPRGKEYLNPVASESSLILKIEVLLYGMEF